MLFLLLKISKDLFKLFILKESTYNLNAVKKEDKKKE
jgi:hypothetical protein